MPASPNAETPIDPQAEHLLALWRRQDPDHAIIVMDEEGRVLAWLGAAERMLGYRAEEVTGQRLSRIFTPEDRERGFDRFELELARTEGHAPDERWHLRKDGTRIWAMGAVLALHDQQRVVGFVKILRDHTDMRMRLQAQENHLRTVQARQDEARRFMRTLGHELRNPLAPMTNATHVLKRLCPEPRAQSMLDIVDGQVAAVRELADKLSEVARLELGNVTLDTRPVDLRQLLRAGVEATNEAAHDAGVQVIATLPTAALMVEADPDRMQRVILDLLGNALKYTPPGGHVWVSATQSADEVVFKVHDTGIGISAEMLPRIFELFTRDLHAQQLVPGGLGVGLALVRQVVALHRGIVQARSPGTGKGSEFIVRLPAAGRHKDSPAG